MASGLKWGRERRVEPKVVEPVVEKGSEPESLPPYICGGDVQVQLRINNQLKQGSVGLVSYFLARCPLAVRG